MKEILVVGGGGREHAFVWALGKSRDVVVFAAPGNAGTDIVGKNLPIGAEDIEKLTDYVNQRGKRLYLTVVGPEGPLAKGIVNEFQERGFPIFGPTKEAAQIEASKVWARHFMERHGIPQPEFATFDNYYQAKAFLEHYDKSSVVVKADGLCGGKGALVCSTQEEARVALRRIMVDREFDSAGDKVVIEERLYGREASVLAFTDGKTVVPMLPAEDYKPVFDGDEGPNTGGMGGVCPHWEVVSPQELEEVTQKILIPTVEGMAEEGRPYQGILYAGLMKDERDSRFKVLEFNCRGGDPENQVILPLLKTPLLPILVAVTQGRLGQVTVEWKKGFCVGVVLASEGYPGKPKTGREIFGLEQAGKKENILVFEAGTKQEEDGKVVTSGGRVLIVVGLGVSVENAAQKTYAQIATPDKMRKGGIPTGKIGFSGAYYRTDIGQRGKPRY